jgi:drug/metabolite transporter (DMT)-like permease
MTTVAAEESRSGNLVAILCMLGGAVGFVVHDAVIKGLSEGYPLHEITLIRGIISTTVTLLVFLPFEGGLSALRTPRWGYHLIRAFLVVVANMAFYLSLASLPIGEATAIYFIAPLAITALSALLLGEHVGPRRWAAVLAGLAGVILVMQPGADSFQPAMLLPLVSALCYAALQVMTRAVGMREKAATMTFYMQFAFVVFSALVGLSFGDGRLSGSSDPSIEFLLRPWSWPSTHDWLILVAVGLIQSVAAYLFVQAYRRAEAGLVAPFEYVAMPIAIVFGVIFWGDWPAPVAWAGIALIAASGLYVFFRETMLGKASDTKKPRPVA